MKTFFKFNGFSKKASVASHAQYNKLYVESIKTPLSFWKKESKDLTWFEFWNKLLEWKEPYSKWFVGGKINVAYNCIDRQLESRGNKAAIIWEGDPGDNRVLTYNDLHREVSKFANVLLRNSVRKGDRVIIYMPMIPEVAIAMLACARIGAVHSVVFGGFSAQALIDRIIDCKAKIIITADGGFRKGKIIPLKKNVDDACKKTKIKTVLVYKRTGQKITMHKNRDKWWHEEINKVDAKSDAVKLDSEHPLFILYTSGSTGKPKGILHTTAGYLMGARLTVKYVFDIKENDIYWCTADAGWITGHTYTIYGALCSGATTVMYEGAPVWPKPDRFWEIVEKYKISVLYTAPTALRTFMKLGNSWPRGHDLSSLRLLGTVGEPINPEVWLWYYREIGNSRCPIVDTWWQTETGSNAITTLPGAHNMKPGKAGLPFFGIDADVVDKNGQSLPAEKNGLLVIKKPWPSMLRGIYGDSSRYKKQYWSDIPGCYFTGDGAKKDKDGYIKITGRVDDVLNVSGHRIGTAEIESALVGHSCIAEAAVVGRPHTIKGEELVAFITLKRDRKIPKNITSIISDHIAKQIGSFARPGEIIMVEALPTTRSGKVMRRLLREAAVCGKITGDITTLEDFNSIGKILKKK